MSFRDDITAILDAEYTEPCQYYDEVDTVFFESEFCDDCELGNAFREANIKVEHQDAFGGEGMGDSYWSVYKFTRGDEVEYMKFEGWYQSYNGSEFTERFWVTPVEVVRIEWDKVKQ